MLGEPVQQEGAVWLDASLALGAAADTRVCLGVHGPGGRVVEIVPFPFPAALGVQPLEVGYQGAIDRGVYDGREGDRPVPGTVGYGNQGPEAADDRGADAPGAREVYAMLPLAQGLTTAATAEALERDPHNIGRWASAFGEGGPAALIFEQTGGSPP